MNRGRAFTLIELLFVVSIIAVLAAIAVPNFLEAQVRSKIGRAQTDMANLKAAIRVYGAKYDAYPPNRPETLRLLKELRQVERPAPTPSSRSPRRPPPPRSWVDAGADRYPFLYETGWDLTRLTTPVAWLSGTLPMDPFSGSSRSRHPRQIVPFIYINLYDVFHSGKETTGTQETKGAREKDGFLLLSPGPDNEIDLPNPVLGPFLEYDATNGTVSPGDLLLFGR